MAGRSLVTVELLYACYYVAKRSSSRGFSGVILAGAGILAGQQA